MYCEIGTIKYCFIARFIGRASNSSTNHSYVLPTFYDLRVKKSSEILQQLKSYFPVKLCDVIKYNVRISESAGFGQTIFEYSPNSTGAYDYKKFVERIMADEK